MKTFPISFLHYMFYTDEESEHYFGDDRSNVIDFLQDNSAAIFGVQIDISEDTEPNIWEIILSSTKDELNTYLERAIALY